MRSLDDSFEGIEKFLRRNPSTNFVAQVKKYIVYVKEIIEELRMVYILFRRYYIG